MLLRALLLVSLLPSAFSMADGVDDYWHEYRYVVKVQVSNSTFGWYCTGFFVGRTAVMSSAECFNAFDKTTMKARVLTPGRKDHPRVRVVRSFWTVGDFTLLKVKERKDEELCPQQNQTIGRLPFSNSTMESFWKPIKKEEIVGRICRILGFYTTDLKDAHRWLDGILYRDFEMPDSLEHIKLDIGTSACWDDPGAPLECELDNGKWTVVGIVKRMLSDAHRVLKPTTDDCLYYVNGIVVSVMTDDSVGRLLAPVYTDVYTAHRQCFDSKNRN